MANLTAVKNGLRTGARICAKRARRSARRCGYAVLGRTVKGAPSDMSFDKARETLLRLCPIPTGRVDADNEISGSIDLSIIIPAYNVQDYVEKCINSILTQQTQYSYEVIVVNDGSTDSTADVLEKFRNDARIRIITQENRGFSGARNRALKRFNGKYVMFVDSDDYILPGCIETLMSLAYENDADVVEGSSFSFNDSGLYEKKSVYGKYCSIVSNPLGHMTGFAWGKVFKNTLFEHLKFPEGFLFEDSIIAMLVLPVCRRCVTTSREVYGYRLNAAGITMTLGRTKNPRCVESQWITEYLLGEQHKRKLLSRRTMDEFLRQTALNIQRVKNYGDTVEKAVFIENCRLYKEYFAPLGIHSSSKRGNALARCLEETNYKKARPLLKWWADL